MWKFTGKNRPSFAIAPQEGEESVWDYPRPPICVQDEREVIVSFEGTVIVQTKKAIRVLETASPPTFYLPVENVNTDLLESAPGQSFCEWKGPASYWSLRVNGQLLKNVAWSYPRPSERFLSIAGHFGFYPAMVECTVNGEKVKPQPGGFYGGWVTEEIIGPYKGEPGTGGW